MSSGQREPSENPFAESDSVEQQARQGQEPQEVQEEQNIEEGSIQVQQAGLRPASGDIQLTQAGLGIDYQEQSNVEQGSIEANDGDEEEEVIDFLLTLAMLTALYNILHSVFEHIIANLPAQEATGIQGSTANVGFHQPNVRPQQGTTRSGIRDQVRDGQPRLGIGRNGMVNPLPNDDPQQGRATNGMVNPLPNGDPQQGRARNGMHNAMPNGNPQQGSRRRRMPNQMPDDDTQQGTARRRMRLQVLSLHSVADCKGGSLIFNANSSCNELHASSLKEKLGCLKMLSELENVSIASTEGTRPCGGMPLDQEAGKMEGDIKGLTSAESGFSSSLTSRLPSLPDLVNRLLAFLGSYLHLRLSSPSK